MQPERNMVCDKGRLVAYRDGELVREERAAVAEHLTVCAGCRNELAVLEHQATDVAAWLGALDPVAAEIPGAEQALSRFRPRVERVPMRPRVLRPGFRPWRPATVGLMTAAATIAVILSFAPARQVAAKFLSIFRVNQFVVVPVDRERVAQLESLNDVIKSGILGEPTVVREPGEARNAGDQTEATALAGYRVRIPSELPADAVRQKLTVTAGPAMRMEVDRAKAQAALEAAGLRDVNLPLMDVTTVDVDVPLVVEQEYRIGAGDARLAVFQAPSPTVSLSSGASPSELGEALLQLLGLSGGDARRMAQSIDWTSTLVIPIPAHLSRFTEVTVDGVQGFLLEQDPHSPAYKRELAVLWQLNGMIYAVCGQNIASAELLRVADSLQ